MTRRRLTRSVLAVDALGCAVAAVAVATSDRIAGAVTPSTTARRSATGALAATGVVLMTGALRGRPTDGDLTRAAAVNVGWVAVCLLALRGGRPPTAKALLAGTAALDGAAAAAQWVLRSGTKTAESGLSS